MPYCHIAISKYDATVCFLLPLCHYPSTFPLDELNALNWTKFSPKSAYQQHLIRGCYQNNTAAKKEALNDGKQIWRRNSTNFAAFLN